MKVRACIDFEIDPNIAASILADPFPNAKLRDFLNGDDVQYIVQDNASYELIEIKEALGKYLAEKKVKEIKQLGYTDIVESVASSINGD